MRLPTFPSPEIAVLALFPGVACRVLASASEGDDAHFVLDTTPEGETRLYGASSTRGDGGWTEGTGAEAPGWTPTDAEQGLGTATAWGRAPEGAVRVRASFRGDVRERPVAGGVYLVAWWRVPDPGADRPRAEAFQVGGRWVPASSHR